MDLLEITRLGDPASSCFEYAYNLPTRRTQAVIQPGGNRRSDGYRMILSSDHDPDPDTTTYAFEMDMTMAQHVSNDIAEFTDSLAHPQ
jgi:hypothetical protein